jgi:hypothetical protein
MSESYTIYSSHSRQPVQELGYTLIQREEHGLRVFENRVLWRMLGPKREKMAGKTGNDSMRGFITWMLYQFTVIK